MFLQHRDPPRRVALDHHRFVVGLGVAVGGAGIVATLGRLSPVRVRAALQDSPLLDRIAPILLTAKGAHWLASETTGTDIAFLLKQNLF